MLGEWNELPQDQFNMIMRLLRLASEEQINRIIDCAEVHKGFIRAWNSIGTNLGEPPE